MPQLAQLTTMAAKQSSASDGVVFAVFAPLGDKALSTYPGNQRVPVQRQALVKALQKVAGAGVSVVALIDLYDDDTYVVEIPAGQPSQTRITSAWNEDMGSPRSLAAFLRHVHRCHPCAALVLALEGHGAGFLPDLDLERITAQGASGNGAYEWKVGNDGSEVAPAPGSPALPVVSPMLPVVSPMLPATRLPISTWGFGWALASAQKAGAQRPAVIHFNNCFNMSVELLHTVAPYADYATGYANYNFFTAGAAYPRVFRRLRKAGSASAEQLAKWFALENAARLRPKGNHPTIGAAVKLASMGKVSKAIDRLAEALIAEMGPNDAGRPGRRAPIVVAATAAQQYDSEGDYRLDPPDQVTDLGGFAARLQMQFASGHPVHTAADDILFELTGVWQYGDFERPWPDENQVWDFRDQRLCLGILFPDPALQGRWDWRSPYYLSGTVDPTKPPAHRNVIGFLAERPGGKQPPWVEFIVRYHEGAPFKGFLRARPPEFPRFNATFDRKLPPPTDNNPGQSGGSQRSSR